MPDIVLIPTSFERRQLEKMLSADAADCWWEGDGWKIERCGFGLIAAAACTAEAIARHRPRRVILLGIAGSLSDRAVVGCAYAFQKVICHGIGVGGSLSDWHQSSERLGWPQCEGDELGSAIGDSLPLSLHGLVADSRNATRQEANSVLSVTTASANQEEAAHRRKLFPDAIAEEMEGFGVAVACARTSVPLMIVRGISNVAGDRDHARWQIADALQSAASIVAPLLRSRP